MRERHIDVCEVEGGGIGRGVGTYDSGVAHVETFYGNGAKIRSKQESASRQSGGDVKFNNTKVCRCVGLALVKGKGIDPFQPGVGRRLFDGVDGADAHGRPDVYTAICVPDPQGP